MRVQLMMALRYLRTRKLRTALTALAVVFGVAILFGMNSLIPTMLQAFRQGIFAAAGKADLVFTSVTDGPFPAEYLDRVQRVGGVAEAVGFLQRKVVLPPSLVKAANPLQTVDAVIVVGVDPDAVQRIRRYDLSAGRFLNSDDSNAVVISRGLAEKLSLNVGDILTLPSVAGTTSFEIVGLLNIPSLPGTEEVYVPLAAAQRLLALQEQLNSIEVILKPGVDRAEAEKGILAVLGDGFQPKPPEFGEELLASIHVAETAFAIFGLVALAIGAFIILNTFRTVVMERRHDLGMLRAVGASRRTIIGLILSESLLQGVLGTALGLMVGYGLALLMIVVVNSTMRQMFHMEFGWPVITLPNLLMAVVLGLGTTLVGGLWPALSASRVMPLEALRPTVPSAYERVARRRGIVGAVLLALAVLALLTGNFNLTTLGTLLFLVGLVLVAPILVSPLARLFGRLLGAIFAREGQMAQENLSRQPSRAAVTASAIMMGLAMIVALWGLISSLTAGFLGYLDRSLRADFLVMPASLMLAEGNVGAGPEMVQTIRQLPGVAEVTTLRLGTAAINGQMLQVVGVDPRTFSRVSGLVFISGDPDTAFVALDQERAVIVNGVLAARNRIRVGETLTLQTPSGKREYQVVGVGSDYLNAKLATAYISQANLERDFHQTTDLLVMVDANKGADLQAIRAQLEELVRRYPAFTLLESGPFRASQERAFQQNFIVFYTMMVMFALPSLLATANTLVINVIERTREIGVLRAIGSTRRQVWRMILAESLLLAALGAAFGILAGLLLGYGLVPALNMSGFSVRYSFPYGGILAGIAVGLLIGVGAAVLPARRAARLDIITALRYE